MSYCVHPSPSQSMCGGLRLFLEICMSLGSEFFWGSSPRCPYGGGLSMWGARVVGFALFAFVCSSVLFLTDPLGNT